MRVSWFWVSLIFSTILFLDFISCGNFGRSSRDPKLTIEFHSEDSPFHHDDDQESISMPNNKGERFLCYLPKVEKYKTGKIVTQQNISSMIVESEMRAKIKTPDWLLDVLKEHCFVRQEGCGHMSSVIKIGCGRFIWRMKRTDSLEKFDLDILKKGGSRILEFVFGEYDAKATEAYNQNLSDVSILKDPSSKDASQRYHAHIFTNGTLCDLTNEPRETEVRFVCSEPIAMISAITELSTCKYALTFQCPTLCKHLLFHEERPVSHTIHCNALPKVEPRAETHSSGGEIAMVTNIDHTPAFTLEYAT